MVYDRKRPWIMGKSKKLQASQFLNFCILRCSHVFSWINFFLPLITLYFNFWFFCALLLSQNSANLQLLLPVSNSIQNIILIFLFLSILINLWFLKFVSARVKSSTSWALILIEWSIYVPVSTKSGAYHFRFLLFWLFGSTVLPNATNNSLISITVQYLFQSRNGGFRLRKNYKFSLCSKNFFNSSKLDFSKNLTVVTPMERAYFAVRCLPLNPLWKKEIIFAYIVGKYIFFFQIFVGTCYNGCD